MIGLIKDWLGGQSMKKFMGIRLKTHAYLKDNNNGRKKAKGTKMWVIKRNLKFKHFKICVEACQIVNKIKYLEKKEIFVDSLTENNIELVKNIQVLKALQRFKRKRHDVLLKKLTRLL